MVPVPSPPELDAGDDRQHEENPQWNAHGGGRIVRMPAHVTVAEEDQEDHPEHVERREEGGQAQHGEGQTGMLFPHPPQDGFLGEKARQRRNPSQGQRAPDEDNPGLGHGPQQPAHPEDVVGAHGMNDGARPEEEQGLEDAVGEQM